MCYIRIINKTISVCVTPELSTKRRMSLVPWGADDKRESGRADGCGDDAVGALTLGALAVAAVSVVHSYMKLACVGIGITCVLR